MANLPILWRIRDFTRKLRAGADAALRSEQLLRRIHVDQMLAEIRQTPRYNDPLRLLSSSYKVFSQNQEDGMIAEVFRRIGTASRRFIEFGVEDGLECNSAFLLTQGWSGAWIEGSQENAAKARAAFAGYDIDVRNQYITVENADALIAELARGEELDLLSIDIDTIDYWIWQAIRTVKPRLVVIEYNATWPPHIRKTVANDPNMVWDGTNFTGASLGALEALGREKGYCLVGCSLSGVNAFFVREDLVGDRFCAPFTPENHYEPPRFDFAGSFGHKPGMGRWVDV
jgi:predicted O-methyltransferase YrrM